MLQISPQSRESISSRATPSWIAGPHGRSIFNFLRNRSTLLCISDLSCLTVPLEQGNFCITSNPIRGGKYYQSMLTNQAIETQCLRPTRSPHREGSTPLSQEAPLLDPSLSLTSQTAQAFSQSCPNPRALCASHWPQSCHHFCSDAERSLTYH